MYRACPLSWDQARLGQPESASPSHSTFNKRVCTHHLLLPIAAGGKGMIVAIGREGRAREVICPMSHREEEEMEWDINPGLLSLALDYFDCTYVGKKENGRGG